MKKFILFVICIMLFVMLACTPDPLVTEEQRQIGATAIAEPMIGHNLISDIYWTLMCVDPGSQVCPSR